MLGGQSSNDVCDEASPPLPFNPNSRYMADLTSYEDACGMDPDLQAFDHNIHECTTRVLNTLAVGVEVRSLSFDSLQELTSCLLEMNQEVVKVILDSKKDIWDNQELFALVEDYFENSLQTLDFCTALERCLKRTRDSQLILQFAVQCFEEEVEDTIGGKRYTKTLEELHKFKAAGDPFTEEFFMLFQTVYKQQVAMLEKLQVRKKKINKKLKSAKTWTRVTNVIFVAAFVSALIFSVVAAAVAAPPVVTAIAGAIAVPIGSVGKWCNSLWKSYQNALKAQRSLMSSMQVGTFIAIKDIDNIRLLVSKLEIQIESFMQSADFAIGEDGGVKLAVGEIKRKLEVFLETIEDLSERADKCSHEIRMARTVVLEKIIKHPNS